MPPKFKLPFVKSSTQAFFQEARQEPRSSWFNALHGYFYGRFTYLYIGTGIAEKPEHRRLARLLSWIAARLWKEQPDPAEPTAKPGFADEYHGKVVPLATARQLLMVNEEIRLPDLEQVIPYTRARALVLKNPDHIAVLDCPCRSARENPCLPLDVCLIVGEPFASFVVEHHPERARRITPQQAVQILEEEDRRGHVHHAFFKDAMLGRFYAICNCCSCCCGAMQAQRSGVPMLAASGYMAAVDPDLCLGCETCVEYCQFDALRMPEFVVTVNPDNCMGCGVCVEKCPNGALSLQRAAHKGEPLEICALMADLPVT